MFDRDTGTDEADWALCSGHRPVVGRWGRGRGRKMTAIQSSYRRMGSVVTIMMVAGLVGWTGRAVAQSVPESCAVASDLMRLDLPLTRVAQRLGNGDPVKIIAIGSSSTAGTGASSRAFSYPSRLEA